MYALRDLIVQFILDLQISFLEVWNFSSPFICFFFLIFFVAFLYFSVVCFVYVFIKEFFDRWRKK